MGRETAWRSTGAIVTLTSRLAFSVPTGTLKTSTPSGPTRDSISTDVIRSLRASIVSRPMKSGDILLRPFRCQRETDFQRLLLPRCQAAGDRELYLFADGMLFQRGQQVIGAFDRLAIDGDDQISPLNV